MSKSKILTPLVGLVVLTLLLAACVPPPTPEVIEKVVTKEVEKIVEVTPVPEEEPVNILIWSHFANEPLMRQVISTVFEDYMAEHPNVNIEVTWWDKQPLRDAIRTVMSAGGSGTPDMTTFDTTDIEWVEAGWLLSLDEVMDLDNYAAGADKDATYPDQGFSEHYKHNMAFNVDYLLYNKAIFDELGIQVPDGYQFTQDEFLEVVQKCDAAGYDGLADGIGNRPYPGQYVSKAALLSRVGAEEYQKYISGQQSWDTPEVRQALEWVVELGEAGLWPDSLATMTIDEFHIYFHTQQKACMLYVGSFFPSRSFKPVEEGGMPRDFRFGFLRYPKMEGAQGAEQMIASFPTGYAVLSTTEHPEVAKDIIRFWNSHPKYGAMWAQIVNMPSAIKYSPEDIPQELSDNEWQWYWDGFNEVYGDVDLVQEPPICGDFNNALTAVLNEGIPLGLMSVDEAIEYLDENLCVDQ